MNKIYLDLLPSRNALISILFINLLMATGIIGGVTFVEYQSVSQLNIPGELQDSVTDGRSMYFISELIEKNLNTEVHTIYLSVREDKSSTEITVYPIMKYNQEGNPLDQYRLGFQFLGISSNQIFVEVRELQNHGVTNGFIPENRYILRITRSYPDKYGFNLMQYYSYSMTNADYSSFTYIDLKIDSGNIYSVLGSPNRTIVAQSEDIFSLLNQKLNSARNFSSSKPLQIDNIAENQSIIQTAIGTAVDTSTIFDFDIMANSSHQITIPQNYINYHPYATSQYPTILSVRDGRINLDFDSIKFNIGEGNQTGTNAADYLYVNFATNQSYYWDLIPEIAERYGIDAHFLPDGRVIIDFIAANITNFYQNPAFDENSPRYDVNQNYDKYFRDRSRWQFVIIYPEDPTIQNFVQFDKSISQTAQSTVIFPRPTHIYHVEYADQILWHSVYHHSAVRSTADNNVVVDFYMRAIQTTDGYSTNYATGPDIYSQSGISHGFSLLRVTYEIKERVNLLSEQKLIGPKQQLHNADQIFNQSDGYKTVERKLSGWSVNFLYNTLTIDTNNGQRTYVLYNAEYINYFDSGLKLMLIRGDA